MKSDKYILFIGAILLCWSLTSCEDDTVTTLTNQEKVLVDSIYKRDLPYIRKQQDSICDAMTSQYFDYFSDSLKIAYIEGIHEIQEYLQHGEE